ncbi:hypothetical protein [Aliiroseovarius crassostreae]|uniref:hypothetical protein n=1 Tax=Aliiroseovarius crassostreae TaxID=154981 RepID=UPI003C7BBBA1
MAFPISPGVFLQDHRRPPEWQAKGVMLFVGAFEQGPAGVPVLVKSRDQARDVFGADAPGCVTAEALQQFFEQGGQTAMVLRIAIGRDAPLSQNRPLLLHAEALCEVTGAGREFDPGPDPITSKDAGWAKAVVAAFGPQDGLAPLRDMSKGRVEMLVAPILSQLDMPKARDVYRKLHRLAVDKDMFLLIDPPQGLPPQDWIPRWFDALGLESSPNAVALAPILTAADGEGQDIAPSGPVAGLLDRVACSGGIWTPPTGGQACLFGLQTSSSCDQENAECPTYLNCLTDHDRGARFGDEGIFSFAGPDAPRLRFLRVLRKTRLTLRAELARLMDEDTPEGRRSEARLIAEALMVQLWRDGALRGRSPSQAYRVTTTEPDPKTGRFELCVGLALQAPGRFLWESVALGGPDEGSEKPRG